MDFVQFCYSIDEPDAEDDILPFCADNGIATLINLPFGGGGLLSRLSRDPLPPLAAELGCGTWAQFCLKYVISHPAVTCAIPERRPRSHGGPARGGGRRDTGRSDQARYGEALLISSHAAARAATEARYYELAISRLAYD